MPYCSIEEAWGNDFNMNINKDNNELDSSTNNFENDNNEYMSFDNDNNNNYSSQYQDFKDLIDEKVIDDNLSVSIEKKSKKDKIEHFVDNEDIVSFRNNKIKNKKKKKIDKTIENFIDTPNFLDKSNQESNMFNILIYILTGIFIIFILDIFTRLGKNNI